MTGKNRRREIIFEEQNKTPFMELREAILEEHSKKQVENIVQLIGNDPVRISELIHIFMQGTYRLVQRAAWVVSGVAERHPAAMTPHIPSLVKRLQDKDAHIAVKRNIYRVMQYLDLPEAVHGDLMNSCFDAVADPGEAAAVRAFGMSILARLAVFYPEIRQELRLVIEDALQYEAAPSFISRARKVLQQIGAGKSENG